MIETTELESTRVFMIDVLKGMLAFFVVLGHYTVNKGDYSLIADLCYSFHMFLFIGVSGWLIGVKPKNIEWLKKRAKRLIVPYCVWSLFVYLLSGDSIGIFIYSFFLEPYWWYLIILFLCDIIVFSLERLIKVKKRFIAAGFFVFIGLNISYVCMGETVQRIETFKMLAIYFPFYFMGYIIRKYNVNIKNWIRVLCMVAYPISMIFYQFKNHDRQMMISKRVFEQIGLADNTIEHIVSLLNPTGFVLYNHFVVGTLGCIFFFNIARCLSRTKMISKIFALLGNYTLQIYLLSGFFTVEMFRSSLLDLIASLLLGIVLPITIGMIIEKNRRIERLLFG